MAGPQDFDRAEAHRLNRGITIMLIVGALVLAISAVLTSSGPIATTLWAIVTAVVLWVAARPLRRR